ncbi:MAG: NAD(P)H-hydrate epimerase, partial [Chloroflexota bacterium]
MKVVTSAQMREIERAAEERGVSLDDLARRAGKSLANLVQNDALDGRVLVLVGPGNNGKDGILCVDALQERGLRPIVYSVLRAAIPSETPHHIRAEDDEDQTQLREILSTRVVIVDALLGVGQNRAPEGLLASVIKTVNSDQSDSTLVVAADIPTGVNADTGAVPGVAIRANLTVAMGFVKLGTALYPGAEYAGHVLVDHLGLDPNLVDLFRINVPGEDEIRELLPVRKAASNKGSSGRMLMIGGSRDFVGAPVLAGLAAYRAGAGLVEIAVPASIQPSVASHALEPIYRSLPDVNGTLGTDAVPIIRAALGHARA